MHDSCTARLKQLRLAIKLDVCFLIQTNFHTLALPQFLALRYSSFDLPQMQRPVDAHHLNDFVAVRRLAEPPPRLPKPRATSEGIDVGKDDALRFIWNLNCFPVNFQRQPPVDAVVVLSHHRLPPKKRVPHLVAQLAVEFFRAGHRRVSNRMRVIAWVCKATGITCSFLPSQTSSQSWHQHRFQSNS